MEKGFNDQELADIMSEIESLEKEYADEDQEVDHTEPEVLQKLAEAPVEKTVLPTNHEEKVVPMKKPAPEAKVHAHAPANLTFQVTGQMTVNLGFEVNGQSVLLAISEDGLVIETESGAKFTLPLNKEAAKKAA
ncbi:MAG: hypothetical protein K2P81_12150 [Bacteriovoracaceae bacterium]|nr:hypothetical protein [Bacteriovoracaceae bacterium]